RPWWRPRLRRGRLWWKERLCCLGRFPYTVAYTLTVRTCQKLSTHILRRAGDERAAAGSMSFIDNSIDWLGAEQYFHQDISGITRGVARVGQNTWGNLRCVGADRKPLGALHTENLLTHC